MTQKTHMPLTLKAYLTLKKWIVDLKLRPGEILVVQPLAKQLGLSRTPVREALVRLQQEGLVTEAEGKKFRVAEITLEGVLEICEIRQLMEGHAIRIVARRRSAEQLAELRRLAGDMESALATKDHHRFFEGDLEFHARLISYCGNQTLEELMSHLVEKIQRIRYLALYVGNRLEETIVEHNRIVDAVERQDPEAACRAVELHLTEVKQGLEAIFADRRMNLFGKAYLANKVGWSPPIRG